MVVSEWGRYGGEMADHSVGRTRAQGTLGKLSGPVSRDIYCQQRRRMGIRNRGLWGYQK